MSPFIRARALTPPQAERRPLRLVAHGVELLDDYAWIRAENWREAIRDPAALPQDIRALLEAENAYAESALRRHRAARRENLRGNGGARR